MAFKMVVLVLVILGSITATEGKTEFASPFVSMNMSKLIFSWYFNLNTVALHFKAYYLNVLLVSSFWREPELLKGQHYCSFTSKASGPFALLKSLYNVEIFSTDFGDYIIRRMHSILFQMCKNG